MTAHKRPRVLLIGESSGNPETDLTLKQLADVTTLPRGTNETLIPLIREAVNDHGPFTRFAATFSTKEPFPSKWNDELLGVLAPDCQCYCGPGAGYDKVDIKWITSTGAMYANSPCAVGSRTADGAIMLLLAAYRGVVNQDMAVREGKFRDTTSKTINWRNSTLGVIGMGNIGRQIADMATALGIKVIYNNRRKVEDAPYPHVMQDELFTQADAIVLACPLTEETRHLINKQAFAKMRDGVIIVNVARGPCIDEAALIEALESRKVLRAALDVFENEPEVHPRLVNNRNVILSGHMAAALDTCTEDINNEVVQNAITFLKSGKPNTAVNLKELAQLASNL